MCKKNKTIKELRAEQCDYNSKLYPFINNWKKNPYTWLKARFYMEASAALVYFLLKTKIKPNTITIIYGLFGLLGGILLAIPNNLTIIIAVAVFFLKGILDWSDGHLARVTGQTSVTGHVLDVYGALLNDLGFQLGLGFYVAHKTNIVMFYYLIPLIPLFYALQLTQYTRNLLFKELSSRKLISEWMQRHDAGKLNQNSKNNKDRFTTGYKYKKYYDKLSSILDARARSVDFICVLILLEMFLPINITWVVFSLLLMKRFLIFIVFFYIIGKGGWAENELDKKMSELFVSFNKVKAMKE